MGRRRGDHSLAEREAAHRRTSIQPEGDTPEDDEKRAKNTRFMRFIRKFYKMPPVNVDNAEEVDERVNAYFDASMEEGFIPTMAGLAAATGVDRRTLMRWADGTRREGQAHGLAVKRFKLLSTGVIINGMLDGSIPPIPGIFVSSNDGDYEQKATHTVQIESGVTSGMSQDQLARRYSPDVIDAEVTQKEPQKEPQKLAESAESIEADKVSIPEQKEPQKV